MSRVLLLVEGQTEETFVNRVLAPHLGVLGIDVRATSVSTRQYQGRREHRGGLSSYAKVKADIRRLLGSNPDAVSTLFDYYGLPKDFPGIATIPAGAKGHASARHIELAFAEDIKDGRFIANLVVHEFEALLFADSGVVGRVLGEDVRAEIEAALAGGLSPEDVNDGPETHPSRRILRHAPRYAKVREGVQIAERIGVGTIRSRCPRFSDWLKRIEALGAAAIGQ